MFSDGGKEVGTQPAELGLLPKNIKDRRSGIIFFGRKENEPKETLSYF